MKKRLLLSLIPVNILILAILITVAFYGSRAVTVAIENDDFTRKHCIIIDAGHGGVDGGATSCTGVYESDINLEFALRLNALLQLLGYQTKMIRTTDISVYTEGESIAQKKISDLKERVRITNSTENPVLISIHQNYFSDPRYSGAQVFYATTPDSERLAKSLQSKLVETVNVGSNRQAKKAKGIYLMERINCTGVLIECGFLSNRIEEAMLRSKPYQLKICAVIATEMGSQLATATA